MKGGGDGLMQSSSQHPGAYDTQTPVTCPPPVGLLAALVSYRQASASCSHTAAGCWTLLVQSRSGCGALPGASTASSGPRSLLRHSCLPHGACSCARLPPCLQPPTAHQAAATAGVLRGPGPHTDCGVCCAAMAACPTRATGSRPWTSFSASWPRSLMSPTLFSCRHSWSSC